MKFILIYILVFLSFSALADNSQTCSAFEAEYAPSSDYKFGEPALFYKLHIKKNENYVGSDYGTKMFFVLETFDTTDNQHVSTYKIPYNCAGGSVPNCYLKPVEYGPGSVPVHLQLAALDKDFKEVGLDIAPYAIAIPGSVSAFYHLNWDKVASMTYHQGDKESEYNQARRPYFMPSLWILKSCGRG